MVMLRFLFMMNYTVSTISMVLSIVTGTISILEIQSKTKKHETKKIWIFLFCVSVIAIVGLIVGRNYVEVPNVVGDEYRNASARLDNCDLQHNIYLGENLIVVEQNPVGGTIVRRNDFVDITVNSYLKNISDKLKSKVIVPDVVGHTYQNACNILSDNQLKYNLILDNGVYVMEQNPVAGTEVEIGTMIELKTEPIGNNPDVRQQWINDMQIVDFGNIEIRFRNTITMLYEESRQVECFGPNIDKFEVQDAYLLEKTTGVEFHDYVVENDALIIKDIPQGIEFQLHIMLDGYEEIESDIEVSANNMVDGTFHLTQGLINKDADIAYPTTFYVHDKNNNPLSGVKLWVMWEGMDNYWTGDYYTKDDGKFQYEIWINKDQKAKVKIFNPFENEKEYECDVTLRRPEVEQPNDNEIIFLDPNGGCKVQRESEYYGW